MPQYGSQYTLDRQVGDWATWASRGRAVPVAVLHQARHEPTVFAADHLLVDGNADGDIVAELVERYGAEVVPEAPLPEPPEGMGPREGVDPGALPSPTTLRLVAPPELSDRAVEELRGRFGGPPAASTDQAALLAGLVADLQVEGRPVGLDMVGRSTALPLAAAVEGALPGGGTFDPFSYLPFAAPYRVTDAWQLVEAFRHFRSVKPLVTVGVLDDGFWLDGRAPAFPAHRAGSDFGPAVLQLNLNDEREPAGGAGTGKTVDGQTVPWHGNSAASVATALVANGLGAAGTGGTVARPVFFKSDLSVKQILRCLKVCLAWGVDVISMSFGVWDWRFAITDIWEDTFRLASDNGLVIVCAAGNSGHRLPQENSVRPATRTPGTLTVGALKDGAVWDRSNYGSSINVWAPSGLLVAANPDSPDGTYYVGTSAAAPFVAGVAAMVCAVAPAMAAEDVRRTIIESGYAFEGHRAPAGSRGVDAYAAVLRAMGGSLPRDDAEANDSPETAADLRPLPDGRLAPFRLSTDGLAVLSSSSDADWYRFDVAEFSWLDLRCTWYSGLGPLLVTLEPDDPESRAVGELTATSSRGVTRQQGLLAPGRYKVHVVGGSPNLYELTVGLTPSPLMVDELERNDSPETATRFHLREPGRPPEHLRLAARGPGRFELTLHGDDRDVFRIGADALGPLSQVSLRISGTDAPVDVLAHDPDGVAVLDPKHGVRSCHLVLPAATTSYVVVWGAAATRYVLDVRVDIDTDRLPGLWQEERVFGLPDLGDPPFRIDREVRHVLVDLDVARLEAGPMVLAELGGRPLLVELLDTDGGVVRTGEPLKDLLSPATALDLADLRPGAYVLRLGGADSDVLDRPLNVEVIPVLR